MALTKTPIELSSTPSIVDGGNATAITIDSSENVGIGTSSPDSYFSKELVVAHGTEGGITLVGAADTATGYLMFADGTTGNERYRGYIGYSHSTPDVMVFGTAGAERMRILSTGGITFNGDTAAANALDDYEEGTWTMGILCSSAATVSIPNTTGRYTKVGNLVTVSIYTENINVSAAGGGTLDITGLPFTVAAGSKSYSAASFAHTTLFSTTHAAYPAINTTFARVTQVGSVSNASLSAGNPKYMMFSLTYSTDA